MKARYVALMLALLSVVIILPPIIHGYVYPTGGDDTAHHLVVMAQITPTHPIPSDCLYAGQWIVGYPLVLLRDYLHIPLTASFLWFNYLALIGVVITSYFVFSKLFNRLAGILVAMVSFLLSANMNMFLAGAVFNLINMGIILLWLLYFGITAVMRKSWRRGIVCLPLLALFAVFHATGQYLWALPIIVLIGWGLRKRIKTERVWALLVLGLLVVALVIVAYPLHMISPDAGRQAVDATVLVWLIVASGVGWWITKKQGHLTAMVVIVVGLIGAFFAFPTWFSYTSAIKPIDKEVIAYVNTLPESEFYGNEYLAPYIYLPYLNKPYSPDGGIYIWRSEPMTAGVTEGSKYNFWYAKGNSSKVTPPLHIKTIQYFDKGGISVYVAEASQSELAPMFTDNTSSEWQLPKHFYQWIWDIH